ncbi:Spo0E family sporulation regulatory protein-aspartic acid phosphatase [Thermanaerosceptrum fracticalcis]|uniref:Spo0E family sporulation regulatory protein-aspartic acid phosphatase n=1 Tax=Thermanaerosceptrum fracticalcis TaxID=1712410 RepID=A0A7G6E1A8_THEFR|nr:aspartyl-phosphate phosphatase Spo0E family protein [Thermanaerosceptrum fracticalcis]QNB45862.1 Spo0E family sporulation regulatory protein-aspartic acid phosphatase [Thermanaerosceptrum fracticalcis]
MSDNVFALHKRLCLLRRRLEEMCEKYGLTDPRVLAMSRKVDRLVVEMQKRLAG